MSEFEIIERVGISPKSISDAVKNALQLIDTNRKIHFFEIIQQRGTMQGNSIEFQVIIKIGIE